MITLKNYLTNPCRKTAIPYWKEKTMELPDFIKVVHDDEYDSSTYADYSDEKYFRLFHDMNNIAVPSADIKLVTATAKDIPTIIDIINRAYTDIQVDKEQMEDYKTTEVYAPDLWILALDKQGKCMGCGIADYDSEVREIILEWIQVYPEYWGKGVGQAIVNELLLRRKGVADFATVSGMVDNVTKPERLYRKCGFTGHDVWHILRRK